MADVKFTDLTVDNLFDFCAVLDAVGTEQMLSAFSREELATLSGGGKDVKDIGIVIAMKVAGIVIKNVPKAREEICSFFAGCMEWDNGTAVTADEVRKFKIGRFMQLIREFFKKDDLADFFKQAAEFAGLTPVSSESLSSGDTAAAQSVT